MSSLFPSLALPSLLFTINTPFLGHPKSIDIIFHLLNENARFLSIIVDLDLIQGDELVETIIEFNEAEIRFTKGSIAAIYLCSNISKRPRFDFHTFTWDALALDDIAELRSVGLYDLQ